jgi:hypothetical protein
MRGRAKPAALNEAASIAEAFLTNFKLIQFKGCTWIANRSTFFGRPTGLATAVGLTIVHWDYEPPRCCRHPAGSALHRMVCRQDAGICLP